MRSRGQIALAVATSGVAALLLEGGTTAHFRYKIPIELDEASTCSVTPHSAEGRLIDRAVLTVWDEAPMLNRLGHEATERTVTDIKSASDPSRENSLFGGTLAVLA